MDYRTRIASLQQKLRRQKIDALLVSQPHNRRYLSGFTACDHDISESSGVLLIPARGKGYLLTDFRYRLQAEQEVTGLHIEVYRKGVIKYLKKLLVKLDIATLGFESHYTLHSTSEAYLKAFTKLKISCRPLTGLVEKLRLIKDESEIEAIRRSVRLNEEVFEQIYPTVTTKMREIDVALAIEHEMRMRGAERPSFDTIVASGDNSALPHAVPSPSGIREDRPLTIDMGLILDGYCSDMTRTFVVGKADRKYQELHRLVRRAQLAGMDAVRAGVTGREVDKAARDIIAAEGYGQYFGHSLGHGVGLAVHEGPKVSVSGGVKLREGMVITLEPGIYIPGWGGVRLENMVVVRKNGCENLNRNETWLDI